MSLYYIECGGTSSGGVAGDKVKIINASMTGTLNRNGSVVSGFDKNNYLTLASRYDNNYLNLDTTNYKKNFNTVISRANFEIHFKIVFNNWVNTDHVEPIFSQDKDWPISWICVMKDVTLGFIIDFYNSNNASDRMQLQIGELTDDTALYIKLTFDGTKYTLATSLDDVDFSNSMSVNSTTLLPTDYNWLLGVTTHYTSQYQRYMQYCKMDLSGCYIKINNEMWWQGITEIQL